MRSKILICLFTFGFIGNLEKGVKAQFATKVWAYDNTGAASGYTDPSKALGMPSQRAQHFRTDNGIVQRERCQNRTTHQPLLLCGGRSFHFE